MWRLYIRLHNLFKKGQLKQCSDGLIVVSTVDQNCGETNAISVPTEIFPGLIQAIHLKLHHPSKMQLLKLCNRYFYSPGFGRVIEEISNNCIVCASLRKLPKEIFSESTTKTSVFGKNFSADVICKHNQKILLIREKLSQFTVTKFIQDETAESLESALISSIVELLPEEGAIVQVDNAPGWQALETRSQIDGS